MNNLSILVIDDNERWLDILQETLQRLGPDVHVDIASGYAAARHYISNHTYDLAIVDIRIEDIDPGNDMGMEVVRELRSSPLNRDRCAIIVHSAYGTNAQMSRAFCEYRVDDFLGKEDFDPEWFLQRAREVIHSERYQKARQHQARLQALHLLDEQLLSQAHSLDQMGHAGRDPEVMHRFEIEQAKLQAEQRISEAELLSAVGQSALELVHRLGNDLGLVRTYVHNIKHELTVLGVISPTIDAQLDRIVRDVQRVMKLGRNLGEAVCRVLRSRIATQAIPIFILSAVHEREAMRRILSEGADDFQKKPPDAELLKTGNIDDLLERLWQAIIKCRLRPVVQAVFALEYGKSHLRYGLNTSYAEQEVPVNLEENQWQDDLRDMAEDLHAHHRDWLTTLRTGGSMAAAEVVETLARRRNWRPRGTSIGRRLSRAIFEGSAGVAGVWARAQPSLGVGEHLLTLRLRGARDSLAIPFELMHAGSRPLAIRHPMSRQISVEGPQPPTWRRVLATRQTQPLRALLLAGEPWACEELQIVASGFQAAMERVDVRVMTQPLDLTRATTLPEAVALMQRVKFDLVHFADHGDLDQSRPEQSYIVLPDEQGNPTRLLATRFASLLHTAQVQFLYLSCCSSAEIATVAALRENAYLGLLDAAVQAGVPAVLGYRWPVVGRWAKDFATHFYAGLSQYPASLELATWWARKQIFETSAEGGWDETWFAPLLVVQNPDYPAEP